MYTMQKICLTILLGLLFNQTGLAQTLKTEILVYGSGPGAAAAGIQSARSGVKTIWLNEKSVWATNETLSNPKVLQSGIWAEFAKNYLGTQDKNEPIPENIMLQADSANAILKKMCDTVKRLSVRPAAGIPAIKKSGKGWEIRLANGQKIKATIVLDASANHVLLKALKTQLPDTIRASADNLRFRTSVATLDSAEILPLGALIPEKTETVIGIPVFDNPISAMHAGQAAGATAAYCSFFKTNTKNLNVRLIQSELLTYKASLIPFGDVLPSDSNFVKVQHVAISGLMNAGIETQNGLRYWMPENAVSTEELKLPMKAFYSRSQIWFADHTAQKLNIKETIDLLMYTATRGEELRREIERNWKSTWGFKNPYQAERPVSRLEFTLLLETYLQPFAVKVNLEGQLLN